MIPTSVNPDTPTPECVISPPASIHIQNNPPVTRHRGTYVHVYMNRDLLMAYRVRVNIVIDYRYNTSMFTFKRDYKLTEYKGELHSSSNNNTGIRAQHCINLT